MRTAVLAATAALALFAAGCGQRQSAVPASDQAASGGPSGSSPASFSQASIRDPRDAPIPRVNGKPLWAPNRQHTAEENAQYQFTKNGGDFGAVTEADYVTKVHAFVEKPPSGVETIDRRNGDRLLYDAKDNVFAVVSRAGAPRTMFKPRDGAAYWAEQKARESQRSKTNSSGGGGDQG